ncbi:MAG TPA: hypothetical protein G4O04_05790 [Anaerolineae bacterium]|nr:hypothetical protein [Anaerolineae bacterium]HIQ08858.1 hypothetical protein [Anaerolineaceae bacterium]
MLLFVAESDERITNPPGWLRQMGHIALQPRIDHTRFKESLLRKYLALLSDTDFNRRRHRMGLTLSFSSEVPYVISLMVSLDPVCPSGHGGM